jgi:hypothetical protein
MEGCGAVELSDWHMWWKRGGGEGLRRLLMDEWDPIGVRGVPEAVDEYDSYAGIVARMLREGASPKEIQQYLTNVQEDAMGLGSINDVATAERVRDRDGVVAALLVEWYAEEMRAADDN